MEVLTMEILKIWLHTLHSVEWEERKEESGIFSFIGIKY